MSPLRLPLTTFRPLYSLSRAAVLYHDNITPCGQTNHTWNLAILIPGWNHLGSIACTHGRPSTPQKGLRIIINRGPTGANLGSRQFIGSKIASRERRKILSITITSVARSTSRTVRTAYAMRWAWHSDQKRKLSSALELITGSTEV